MCDANCDAWEHQKEREKAYRLLRKVMKGLASDVRDALMAAHPDVGVWWTEMIAHEKVCEKARQAEAERKKLRDKAKDKRKVFVTLSAKERAELGL